MHVPLVGRRERGRMKYSDGIKTQPVSDESHVTLYADDTLLYRPITSSTDYVLLTGFAETTCSLMSRRPILFNPF